MKLAWVVILGVFIGPFNQFNDLLAQSYYSQNRIGLTRPFVSGQSVGMGGVGIAISDPLSLNYLNPAALANLQVTFVSGNFIHEVNTLSGTPKSAVIANSNVDGVIFNMPLKAGRASFALGLIPYSSIEYRFEDRGVFGATIYEQIISGDGGMNTAFLTLGVRPIKRVAIGVTGLYYLGRLRDRQRINFASESFLDTRQEVAEDFTAGGIRLGIQAEVLDNWMIGAVVSPGVSLNTNRTVTIQNLIIDDFEDRALDIPLSYGFGTSVLIRKFLLGADYYAENWENAVGAGYDHNSSRIGLGIEFSERNRGINASFLSRMAVRAGFSYRDIGIEVPAGENVKELFGSIGVGLPIKWTAARLDMSLEIGRRGSTDHNPVQENIIRMSATITAGERWFYRGRRR